MTFSHYSLEAPRAAASLKHVFGLDLGQVNHHSPTAVLDHSRTCVGQCRVTYDWIFEERCSFRHLERLPLGLDYPSTTTRCRLMPVTITAGNCHTCQGNSWGVPRRDLTTGLLLLFQPMFGTHCMV